jgi:amino acid transporter
MINYSSWLSIDFTQPMNIIIFIFFVMIILILTYLQIFALAGILAIFLGFILLFSGINQFICFLIIISGLMIMFLSKKGK